MFEKSYEVKNCRTKNPKNNKNNFSIQFKIFIEETRDSAKQLKNLTKNDNFKNTNSYLNIDCNDVFDSSY